MLELHSLSAGYEGRAVLSDIDLTFEPGTVTALIGRNGCGKSTLLKTACRLLPPMGGAIVMDGEKSASYDPKDWARLVSVLPQSRLVPSIPVQTLVMHGRFPYLGFSRKARPEDKAMVESSMRRMDVWAYRHKNMDTLSGGERQKVYLAMLLAQDARYIFLDEPATFLDIHYRLEILRLMRELRDEGRCVIAVMHELSHALSVADKVCLLDGGDVVMHDTPQAVYASGAIERCFQVRSRPVETEDGTTYFFY